MTLGYTLALRLLEGYAMRLRQLIASAYDITAITHTLHLFATYYDITMPAAIDYTRHTDMITAHTYTYMIAPDKATLLPVTLLYAKIRRQRLRY